MPVLGAVVRPFRPVPVKRGAVDLRAIKLCLEHLARGPALLIFPEGKISRDGHLQAPHEGLAFLAYRAAVPVIPVGIRGTYRVWPLGTRFPHRGRIEVYLGPAILPEGEPTREHQTELTAHLMRAIAGLAGETLNREGAAAQANGGDVPG